MIILRENITNHSSNNTPFVTPAERAGSVRSEYQPGTVRTLTWYSLSGRVTDLVQSQWQGDQAARRHRRHQHGGPPRQAGDVVQTYDALLDSQHGSGGGEALQQLGGTVTARRHRQMARRRLVAADTDRSDSRGRRQVAGRAEQQTAQCHRCCTQELAWEESEKIIIRFIFTLCIVMKNGNNMPLYSMCH